MFAVNVHQKAPTERVGGRACDGQIDVEIGTEERFDDLATTHVPVRVL
jgi:hypothetical protein